MDLERLRKYSVLNSFLLSPDFSEGSIREYLGDDTKFKVLNSVGDAFSLALQFCNVAEGDFVLTQAIGAKMALDSIIKLGASPILIDSEAANWNISAMMIEVAINQCVLTKGCRPKAIVVKHYMGVPAFMDEVVAVAKRHHIPLIEDCIGSMGASFNGKACGTFGQYAIFSIRGSKMNKSGLGLLVHSVPRFDDLLQKLVERDGLGYKGDLDGTFSLSEFRRELSLRKRVFDIYTSAFSDIEGVNFYKCLVPNVQPNHAYSPLVVQERLFPHKRDEVVQAIADAGFEDCCAFPPSLHTVEPYKNLPFYGCMVGSDICTNGLILPSNSSLSISDIDKIVGAVFKTLGIKRK